MKPNSVKRKQPTSQISLHISKQEKILEQTT